MKEWMGDGPKTCTNACTHNDDRMRSHVPYLFSATPTNSFQQKSAPCRTVPSIEGSAAPRRRCSNCIPHRTFCRLHIVERGIRWWVASNEQCLHESLDLPGHIFGCLGVFNRPRFFGVPRSIQSALPAEF